MFVVLSEFSSVVWVSPEDSITVPIKGGDPVTLSPDPSPLPCGSAVNCEFFTFPKLDRVIILGLDRLEVFDDGPKVNMVVAEDIAPKGVREWWTISLGIETTDSIFGIKIVDGLEHLSFSLSAEICPTSPGRTPPMRAPVPGIVWIMDVVIVLRLF